MKEIGYTFAAVIVTVFFAIGICVTVLAIGGEFDYRGQTHNIEGK